MGHHDRPEPFGDRLFPSPVRSELAEGERYLPVESEGLADLDFGFDGSDWWLKGFIPTRTGRAFVWARESAALYWWEPRIDC